ncbi:MAG: pppA [Planctomycetaceae bacterium]|nr:pppA [Planctomycetaceae bacterium]
MIPYDLPPYFMLSWMFLYGAVIGSFLTVCVHRLPMHGGIFAAWRSLVDNASHCDRCQQKLLARDNIPIFGWLLLGGRCRFCKTSIPVKYPLIELANGLLFALLYAMEVPLNYWNPLSESCLSSTLSPSTFDNVWGLSPLVIINCRYFYHLVLLETLFVASMIDWDIRTIPLSVTLPAMLAGVTGAAAFGQFWLVPVWFQDVSLAASLSLSSPTTWTWSGLLLEVPAWIGKHPHWHGLAVSLMGIAVGAGLGWSILVVGKKLLGRDVLRFGDVMLLATIGSFVGWQPIAIVILFMAPLVTFCATSIKRRLSADERVQYESCLSTSAVLVLLSWRWIWPDLEQCFSMGPVLMVLALAVMAACLPAITWIQYLRQRSEARNAAGSCV